MSYVKDLFFVLILSYLDFFLKKLVVNYVVVNLENISGICSVLIYFFVYEFVGVCKIVVEVEVDFIEEKILGCVVFFCYMLKGFFFGLYFCVEFLLRLLFDCFVLFGVIKKNLGINVFIRLFCIVLERVFYVCI